MSNRSLVAEKIRSEQGPIFITSHNSPDGDAIGSLLALTLALQNIGKTVYPVLLDEVPDNLVFLPGTSLIQKPSVYGVPTEGLLISVDVSGRPRMNIPTNWELPIVVIDHHLTGKQAEGIVWSCPEATATGQLIEELIREEFQVTLTKEIATCLYLAIATDSGFFKYSNTTPVVLRTAATLVEAGAEPNFLSENFEVRPLWTLQRLAESLSTLEVYFDGRLAEMSIITQDEDPAGFSEGFVDFPRSIPTAEVAAFYKQVDSATTRVSLRSKGMNVAQVAESLGGGGHYRAAGLTFSGTLAEAKLAIRAALAPLMEG